jgi:hypothetical protein
MATPASVTLAAVVAGAFAAALTASTPLLPHASIADAVNPGVSMSHQASGPFDVQLIPQKADNPYAEGAGIGRLALDKRFHGALEATSQGEMIAFRDAGGTSGGYVALETVRGTLGGRSGTFVLQHSSTMTRGEPTQSVTVVPDSGTDDLAGLAGRMVIDIGAGGAHAYRFDYTLP